MDKNKAYIDQISDYIKKNLKKGYTKDTLHVALTNQGHSKLEIERAFQKAETEMARDAPVLKTKPQIDYELVEPKSIEHNPPSEKQSFWKRLFG